MRRQAVHEDGVRRRAGHELFVHLVGRKNLVPLLLLRAPGPCWPRRRCRRRPRRPQPACGSLRISMTAPVCCAMVAGIGHDLRIGCVALRASRCECCEPRVRRSQQQRMRHVVAVADVGEADFLQIAKPLLQSEVVGQRLAGMLQVAERVDHRNAGVLGHSFDRPVRDRCAARWHPPSARRCARCRSASRAHPDGPAVWSMKNALPPRLAMPASKVSRVRSDGFSKNITICLPASASGNSMDAPSTVPRDGK